mmetsp:Transcript_15120/g.22651  ORF Transcript_15120/g.22651 Transcript_15120/m.22651 type:complete len:504 (+) Transcript_15120:35-1546(+)
MSSSKNEHDPTNCIVCQNTRKKKKNKRRERSLGSPNTTPIRHKSRSKSPRRKRRVGKTSHKSGEGSTAVKSPKRQRSERRQHDEKKTTTQQAASSSSTAVKQRGANNPKNLSELSKKSIEVLKEAKFDLDADKSLLEAHWIDLLHILRFLRVDDAIEYTQERQKITKKNLEQFQKDYFSRSLPKSYCKIGIELGTGGFGSVFEVSLNQKLLRKEAAAAAASASSSEPANGKGKKSRKKNKTPEIRYAVKVMDISDMPHKTSALNEIRFLSTLHHPNIVTYFESFLTESGKDCWVFMERLEGGTLRQAAEEYRFLEKHIAYTAKEILTALAFLHEKGIVHRDLKSENIMMTTDGQIKLIDFGLCTEVPKTKPLVGIVGSPYWVPPEMIHLQPHDTSADIWSFGVSLLELANGRPPNKENPFAAMFSVATKGIPQPFLDKPEKWSDDIKDFLSQCLQIAPSDRPSAQKLLEHDFLRLACTKKDMHKILSSIFLKKALENTGLFGM